ncbi:unnamed protein product, partial [Polarella glacialis]
MKQQVNVSFCLQQLLRVAPTVPSMSAYIWEQKQSRRSAKSGKKNALEAKTLDAQQLLASVMLGVEPPPYGCLLDLVDIAGGHCEKRLPVPEGCIGLLIGKKGENLKNVEKRWK